MTKISEIGGEQALIKRISKSIRTNPAEVILGIGDDAAVTNPKEGMRLVSTTDMLVENSHFLLSTYTGHQIGRKAAVANISDIAAMGAVPKHMLVSLAIPENTTVEFIDDLYSGIRAETEKHMINIIGGNITGSPSGALIINVTLLGETDTEIRRSGAKPGDLLMVTGDLGGSGAGLYLFEHNTPVSSETAEHLKKAHLEPNHRLKESHVLKKLGCITSMNDISDGLATETREICEASSVGALIYKDRIPTTPATDELLRTAGKDTKDTALYGGEDFELLFTAKKGCEKMIIDTLNRETGTKATVVGRITQGNKITLISGKDKLELRKSGYDHFMKNPFDYEKK